MSRLIFQKSYIRDAFGSKKNGNNSHFNANALFNASPRTTFDTFWYMYLASYVNEIGHKQEKSDEDYFGIAETRFEDDENYSAYIFDELTLTYSTVGYLPEQINYFYVENRRSITRAAKIFASYMVLLGANYVQNKLGITGVDRETKGEVVSGFDKYYSYLKTMIPDNPMIVLFDICMNAVSVNTDNMLSFNMSEIIEFFKDNFEVDLTRCNFKNVEFLSKIDGTDILAILQSSEKLYPEDLEYFMTELETSGNYDDIYVKRCKAKIEELTKPHISKTQKIHPNKPSSVYVSVDEISPFSTASLSSADAAKLRRDQFISDITKARNVRNKEWTDEFRAVVSRFKDMSVEFIKDNASFFLPKELNILLNDYDMGEEFLEQYFSSLDPVVIACHQHFSEAFFMKHFAELNYNNVLKKGVNDWRKKEKRSKQLDVFLRLKGVTI